MTNPIGPNSPHQQNHQVNQASNGGTIYSSQGGPQQVNITNNMAVKAARSRAGWAVLTVIVVDIAFFFYAMVAYTGQPNNSADLWRAGIFIVLLGITGNLIRRWIRRL
jgi:hypothetical protein